MRYAIQKSAKGYIPSFVRTQHPKPEIRYYDADSKNEVQKLNVKEHGYDWQYTKIVPVFETGDYVGDCNDNCYLVKAISDEMITLYNEIIDTEWTDYVDYEKWHLLRKHNDEEIVNYPIGSQWKCKKESGLINKTDIVTITDYAISKGTFWVRNERIKSCNFIVEAQDLYR